MRNAPANRAMAAISAVVAANSAVEARSDAARSADDETTYGSRVRLVSNAWVTPAGSVPGASTTSTRETPVSSKIRSAVMRGTTTVRPSAPPSGPSPARRPMILDLAGFAGAERIVSDDPTGQAFGCRQALRDQRTRLVFTGEGTSCDQDQVMHPRVRDRVDAKDRHGRCQATGRRRGAQVGPPFQRGRRDRDARGGRDRRHRVGSEPGLPERRDSQIGPSHEVARGAFGRGRDPGVGGQAREQHRDPERDAHGREERPQGPGGEAPPGEPGQAVHRGGRLEPELGEPGDQRCRVVRVAPSELDGVADPAVADHQDAIGVGRGLRIVGDEDDRLAAARRTSARARRGSRCRSCSRGCRSARPRTGGPVG